MRFLQAFIQHTRAYGDYVFAEVDKAMKGEAAEPRKRLPPMKLGSFLMGTIPIHIFSFAHNQEMRAPVFLIVLWLT